MKVEFRYPRAIDGIHYSKGVHELSNSLVDHWFFKGLVDSKDVIVKEIKACDSVGSCRDEDIQELDTIDMIEETEEVKETPKGKQKRASKK